MLLSVLAGLALQTCTVTPGNPPVYSCPKPALVPPAAAIPATPATPPAAPSPQPFAFAYATFQLSTRPLPNGGYGVATPLTSSGAAWNITGTDYQIIKGQLYSITWTAIATQSRTIYGMNIFVLGGPGGAVSQAGTASFALTGATIADIPIKGGSWGHVDVGYMAVKTAAGIGNIGVLGWGRAF